MICPTCKSDMIVVEYNEIELDYCNDCHGVWFDAGELKLLLNSMDLENQDLVLHTILNYPESASPEKKRKCPICKHKMKKTAIGHQSEILIDVCWDGDGLWFDGGEVVHLIRQLGGEEALERGSQQKVISFLGEVFQVKE